MTTELAQITVSEDTILADALPRLNSVRSPLLLIINADGCLVGTITDGDVRRGLLRGITSQDSVDKVMQKSPTTALVTATQQELIALAQLRGVRQIPLLDAAGKPQKLFDLKPDHTLFYRNNPAVIMCGGLGKRMGDLTRDCPKSMLKLNGRPILEEIITKLVNCGIRRIYLAINHLGHIIEDYFANGSDFAADISYLRENKRLGTAGALSLLPDLPKQSILVMNGDIYTHFDLERLLDFHEQSAAAATMAIAEYRQQNPFGVVEFTGDSFVTIKEKPVITSYINAGIYMLNPEILTLIPYHEYMDMPDLLQTAKKQNHDVRVCPICENWIDIGSYADYLRALEYAE